MATTDSLQRLIESYRLKVVVGEKHIDPASMVRDRCKYCKRCRGAGCKEVMQDLPAFEKWLRVDRFVGEYMSGVADLAGDGRSPDVDWSNDLAIAKGMLDIIDDCVNAAAEEEVRLRKLIPAAIAETAAHDRAAEQAVPTPARDKLLVDTYRWLRPQLSEQLNGSNWQTLAGKVYSSSIMGWWTVKFLEGLGRFNQRCRVRRVKQGDATEVIEEPFAPEQLVGNFLNFMGARKHHALRESVARVRRHAAASVHGEEGAFEIEDGSVQPDEQVALEERRQHVITSVTDAVRVLPEPHRSVFRLMDIEGRSMADAAEILGKTKNSLKHIHPAAVRMVRELVPIQD
jgi:hypothetical protein